MMDAQTALGKAFAKLQKRQTRNPGRIAALKQRVQRCKERMEKEKK